MTKVLVSRIEENYAVASYVKSDGDRDLQHFVQDIILTNSPRCEEIV